MVSGGTGRARARCRETTERALSSEKSGETSSGGRSFGAHAAVAEPESPDAARDRFAISDESSGRQQHKSSRTRVALLEAAIACLAEHGYATTTTQLIARRAGLSRGAMLHHYATKRALIDNVIDYICHKRLGGFSRAMSLLSDEQRVEQQAGLELYWESFLSRDYQAFLELQVAARTDSELRAVFEPKARRFDTAQRLASRSVFPEYADDWGKLDLAVDFCQATMQGLLLNRATMEPRARRVAVRRLFSAAIYAFRTGALTIDNHPEPEVTALDQPVRSPAISAERPPRAERTKSKAPKPARARP